MKIKLKLKVFFLKHTLRKIKIILISLEYRLIILVVKDSLAKINPIYVRIHSCFDIMVMGEKAAMPLF